MRNTSQARVDGRARKMIVEVSGKQRNRAVMAAHAEAIVEAMVEVVSETSKARDDGRAC